MKTYISGPITTDHNWKRHFKEAEKKLGQLYATSVINPVDLEEDPNLLDAQKTLKGEDLYLWILKRDVALLTTCDHILLLDGWQESRGAKIELAVALMLNIKVLYEEADNDIIR